MKKGHFSWKSLTLIGTVWFFSGFDYDSTCGRRSENGEEQGSTFSPIVRLRKSLRRIIEGLESESDEGFSPTEGETVAGSHSTVRTPTRDGHTTSKFLKTFYLSELFLLDLLKWNILFNSKFYNSVMCSSHSVYYLLA